MFNGTSTQVGNFELVQVIENDQYKGAVASHSYRNS